VSSLHLNSWLPTLRLHRPTHHPAEARYRAVRQAARPVPQRQTNCLRERSVMIDQECFTQAWRSCLEPGHSVVKVPMRRTVSPWRTRVPKPHRTSILACKVSVNMLCFSHEKDTHNRPFRGHRQRGYRYYSRILWPLIERRRYSPGIAGTSTTSTGRSKPRCPSPQTMNAPVPYVTFTSLGA
jgi:hypothetical protein